LQAGFIKTGSENGSAFSFTHNHWGAREVLISEKRTPLFFVSFLRGNIMSYKDRKLVSACGFYCGACNDYISYVTHNKELLEKVAVEINKQLNINISADQVGCLGCWGDIHNLWSSSLDCKIRHCAESKNIMICALCVEFPCERFDKQFNSKSQQRKNCDRIKEIGFELWLNEKEEG